MKLKELRLKKGASQRSVADALHCTPMSYSRYESGKREPSIALLCDMADYFGVSLDELLERNFISNVDCITTSKGIGKAV
jgi:transcriptional regulator with XRE-family HTH domain